MVGHFSVGQQSDSQMAIERNIGNPTAFQSMIIAISSHKIWWRSVEHWQRTTIPHTRGVGQFFSSPAVCFSIGGLTIPWWKQNNMQNQKILVNQWLSWYDYTRFGDGQL